MIVSLNEVAVTAAKAVRGCGHPVGVADDMGFAVSWLCEHELPGVTVLLSALADSTVAPPVVERSGAGLQLRGADDAPLSTLAVAASVIELAVAGDPGRRSITVDSLTHPLLMVPFVARYGSGRLTVRWSTRNGHVVVESQTGETGETGELCLRARSTAVFADDLAHDVIVGFEVVAPIDDGPPVAVSAVEMQAAAKRTLGTGCAVGDDEWERLGRLAWRTYVPASDESRLRGAGAGLTDND